MYVSSRFETLHKAPITKGAISVLTLCSVLITLAKSIPLLLTSCSISLIKFMILRYSCINHLPLPLSWHLYNYVFLLCFIFAIVLTSASQRISIPVSVTVCGNGTCSYLFLVTFSSNFLYSPQ